MIKIALHDLTHYRRESVGMVGQISCRHRTVHRRFVIRRLDWTERRSVVVRDRRRAVARPARDHGRHVFARR